MSKPWFISPATPGAFAPRGAAPVGVVADLPVLEQGAVLLMRHWCDSPAGRGAVTEDFITTLGPDRAGDAVAALDHLITLLVHHGRRPFMRHDIRCTCLGGDESAFALLVAAAMAGEREDAMALALTMLPADLAFEAVQTAEPLGLMILAMARRLRSQRAAETEFAVPPGMRPH